MALTLDVSNLTSYIDQLQFKDLIRPAVLPSTLMNIGVNYEENVTNISDINIVKSFLNVKSGSAGGAFNASGTASSLYQRPLQVYQHLVEEEDNPEVFKNLWTKAITKAGSYNESNPDAYNRIYTAYKMEQVKGYVEDSFFYGSLSGTYSTSLNLSNGIFWQLEYTSDAPKVILSATAYNGALTTANAIAAFDDMRKKCPTNILGAKDLVMLMGHADFFTLTQALRNQNYFTSVNYSGKETEGDTLMIRNILGTNITVYAMRGCDYGNKILLTNASNLYLGTDLNGDYETMDTWYSKDAKVVRTIIKWRQGAMVAFPEQCVLKP